MTCPRYALESLQDTPYFHIVSRCVRRAWLWGYDRYSKTDYSHRKAWVLDRLRTLTGAFAIRVSAYAVLSNHVHAVIFVDEKQAKQWTQAQVLERWSMIFRIPLAVRLAQRPTATDEEKALAAEIIETLRTRLYNMSWFMRCLSEFIAKKANEEDGCTGRFWQGRFKSQALPDEAGLLTAMAYVDLNPVRAGIAQMPEESDYTSIYARIRALKANETPPVPLQPFRDDLSVPGPRLPFKFADYLELVDWTGKHIRKEHKGAVSQDLPSILTRLSIRSRPWRTTMTPAGNHFGRAIGHANRLRLHASNLGQSWIAGLYRARRLFGH